jgi:hypothetical protein
LELREGESGREVGKGRGGEGKGYRTRRCSLNAVCDGDGRHVTRSTMSDPLLWSIVPNKLSISLKFA